METSVETALSRWPIFQLSLGNRLIAKDRCEAAYSEKEQLSLKQRESVRLKESERITKPETKESSSASLSLEFTCSSRIRGLSCEHNNQLNVVSHFRS